MDWKDIAGVIGNAAPLLGTLIGGPAGAAVGSIVASALGTQATPDAVSQAIATNPDAAIKLRQIEADQATKLRELAVTAENNRLIAETAAVAAVNATMQAEAKADHWPTYSWRPFIGFCFGVAWLGVYLVLPILRGYLPSIVQPTIPPEAWLAVGGILGVASWYRGKMQADPGVKTDSRG
jgi:hypothetical protein